MRSVFADTLYWVALTLPGDPWYLPAITARNSLGPVRVVTTDAILTEFLTALAGGGEFYRGQAAQMVRELLSNGSVTVLPQSRETFLDGLDLYEHRMDKGYSLTDCISMNVMRSLGLHDVLTNDHHFAQEGFTTLITR